MLNVMQHISLKQVMIHANDPGEHTVCWSELGQRWLVENPKDGLVQSFHQLCQALGSLHYRSDRAINGLVNETNKMRDESIARVASHWTMTENPYA